MDRIELNQLAWKTNTPWHGKGIQVPMNATGIEMLRAAGLDFPVVKVPIQVPGSSPDQSASFHAIQREDTGQIFTVTRERYNVVQNSQIVDFFREYCEAGKAEVETVGAIDGGAKIWALARLKGADTKLQIRNSKGQIAGGEEIRGYMLLASSHDMTLQHVAKPTQVCVVCWNTLSAALGLGGGRLGKKEENEFRAKHSRKWSPTLIAEAQKTMGIAVEKVEALNELARKLSKVSLDAQGEIEYLDRLLFGAEYKAIDARLDTDANKGAASRVGQALLESIHTSPGSDLSTRKGTMWGAVNGITYHVDHVKGKLQDTRLSSAWFGDGVQLKQRAVNVALEMVGV